MVHLVNFFDHHGVAVDPGSLAMVLNKTSLLTVTLLQVLSTSPASLHTTLHPQWRDYLLGLVMVHLEVVLCSAPIRLPTMDTIQCHHGMVIHLNSGVKAMVIKDGMVIEGEEGVGMVVVDSEVVVEDIPNQNGGTRVNHQIILMLITVRRCLTTHGKICYQREIRVRQ